MLEALSQPEAEALCPTVKKAIATFDDKDLKKFLEALNNLEWAARDLSSQLKTLGFNVSENQIWKHRANSCACA
jgi:hypothetical protein